MLKDVEGVPGTIRARTRGGEGNPWTKPYGDRWVTAAQTLTQFLARAREIDRKIGGGSMFAKVATNSDERPERAYPHTVAKCSSIRSPLARA